jgi:pimeloyl-ACP methyl ester carboxylesterase
MNTVRYLPRPEGRVAYTLDGPADGRLVVLVPGMGDLRATWRDLVGPLAGAGYRVATTDLRGHGDSDTTFRTFGDIATAGDVLALVDELGGGPAVLVGNSMGAAAVTWAAAERPDLVAALVLTGPLLRNPGGKFAQAAIRLAYPLLFARPWGARLWASYYRGTLNRGRHAPWLDEHVAAIRGSYADAARLAQFRALTWQLTHEPVERRLPEVHVPILAFVGRRDPDFRDPAAEAAWLEHATGARVTLLDDVAHYPQHQASDLVVPQVLDFLATLPALPARAAGDR